MNTPDIVIGIDLGTTNSAVAVAKDGKVEIIPVHGSQTMPSAVGVDPTGKLIIGKAAKNQSISAPESTVLSAKRLMGTEETVSLGSKDYRPEEISALILGELKKAAETHLGQPVNHAVITVPAFFNERQRQATQDAGTLAGLTVMRIINEPTAAALAYGAGAAEDSAPETILVYDLGGGTFDVSLVTIEKGIVEVKASHGDTHLGGDDFDQALAELAQQRHLEAHPGATFTPVIKRRIKGIMERAKIALSDAPYVQVREEYLTPEGHLDTELSRDDYEQLIDSHLEKTLVCLQQTLEQAASSAAAVDKIMLVGGATRTPRVMQMLQQLLGNRVHQEIDPDLIVAMGAAVQGATLAGQPAPAILIDITAHSYSNAALAADAGPFRELICVPIISRGTALPVTKSEVFSTHVDNQPRVQIDVYQGESYDPEQNNLLGTFFVEDLASVARGNEIIVQFKIDLNGMLTTTATEKRTGNAKTITFDTSGQHRINLDAARSNLAELLGTDSDDKEVYDDEEEEGQEDQEDSAAILSSAKSLRRRADALVKKGINDSDAATIQKQLEDSTTAIQAKDWPSLSKLNDSLSDLLFYLDD